MAKKKAVPAPEPPPIILEAHLLPPHQDLPGEKEEKRLTLARTKAYTEDLLKMDEVEAMQMIRDQATTRLLLIGEQILKEVELLDAASDWRERAAIALTIETLTKTAASITATRSQLDKTLGKEIIPQLPASAATLGEEEGEITLEEFEREYVKKAQQHGTTLIPPAKA